MALDITTHALSVAEENNILHRDIKPANILFTKKGNATLADLGPGQELSGLAGLRITQTGIACGPRYIFRRNRPKAPEIWTSLRHLFLGNNLVPFA